ncbi:MAG: hypothetical protein JOZ04_13845 [Acidimicrobiia bacterium]|nr:hypothetical protein [Acidimicrobiia bacterium]
MRRLGAVVLTLALPAAGIAAAAVPSYGVRPAGTGTGGPACGAAALERTTSTDRPAYSRGQPIRISTSTVNTSSRTCGLDIRACVSATVTNAAGTVEWSAVPFNALCAQYLVHQRLAPGAAVTRSWTWDQHVCILIGQCPGAQVPPGRYTAQGHWGGPGGDATPVSFTIQG